MKAEYEQKLKEAADRL
jgi:hypothetical protein